MGIKPGRHKDEVGPEGARGGGNHAVEHRQRACVPGVPRQRDVDGGAAAGALSNILRPSGRVGRRVDGRVFVGVNEQHLFRIRKRQTQC